MPTRIFRQGSPGYPYLKPPAHLSGYMYEIEPAKVASKLMKCRERIAGAWVVELDRLTTCELPPPPIGGVAPAEGEGGEGEGAADVVANYAPSLADYCRDDEECPIGDVQLLHGIATRVALREMLKDLYLRPSQAQLHVSWDVAGGNTHSHDTRWSEGGDTEMPDAEDFLRQWCQPRCGRGGDSPGLGV